MNCILLNAFLVDVLIIIIIIIINLATCFDLAAIIWPIEMSRGYICESILIVIYVYLLLVYVIVVYVLSMCCLCILRSGYPD